MNRTNCFSFSCFAENRMNHHKLSSFMWLALIVCKMRMLSPICCSRSSRFFFLCYLFSSYIHSIHTLNTTKYIKVFYFDVNNVNSPELMQNNKCLWDEEKFKLFWRRKKIACAISSFQEIYRIKDRIMV